MSDDGWMKRYWAGGLCFPTQQGGRSSAEGGGDPNRAEGITNLVWSAQV